jgi:hypothetical protein
MGSFIVLVVVFAPRGLLGLVEHFYKNKPSKPSESSNMKPLNAKESTHE